MRTFSLATASLALLFGAGWAAGCGTQAASQGGWVGGASEGGADDAGLDLGGAWPRSDPNPDGGVHGGPHFDAGDGAARDAGAFACTGKLGAGGDTTISIVSGGIARTSLLHVPASYDPAAGAPLVMNFHGYTSNAAEEVILTRMNATSDARGFIVAYPEGIQQSWNAGDCCGVAWTNSVDDIAFTQDLLLELETDYCVDPKRIYATGMSNGGFFAHRLACALAGTFAAVAPVAGVLGIAPENCEPSRPVPVLHFHGTADPIVPYNGGVPVSPVNFGGPIVFRSVAATIDAWRAKDGCLGAPTKIYATGDATCTEYASCNGGSDVTLCTIDNGGHTWPGGVPIPFLGNTSSDISATETMADFFAQHPMP